MFRTITIVLALTMLPVAAIGAQRDRDWNRDRDSSRRDVARAQGIPPGQLPPAGMCRVWYDGVPAGRQPRPTSCREAEALASRDRRARVIYGEDVYRNGRYGNGRDIYRNDPYGTGRNYPYPDNDRGVYRVPGRNRAPNGSYDPYSYPNSSGRYGDTAYENGYRDGLEQGRRDGRDRDQYNPTRHGRYRSADRGYIDSYGSKSQYKDAYRNGFQAGYTEGYRDTNYYR